MVAIHGVDHVVTIVVNTILNRLWERKEFSGDCTRRLLVGYQESFGNVVQTSMEVVMKVFSLHLMLSIFMTASVEYLHC